MTSEGARFAMTKSFSPNVLIDFDCPNVRCINELAYSQKDLRLPWRRG